jgi:DNA-binding SARP family transcriptional activator/predicted ATPase
MARFVLNLLGPPRITIDGAAVPAFDYAKVLALLVYLAVEADRPHSRDSLAELLWPDQAPQVGRSSLRQALARLRSAIGDQEIEPPHLLVTRETVQFNQASDAERDTATYMELLAPRAGHAHREAIACPACLERWEQAVALYRGPFAEGAVPRGADSYEEWLLVRREWFARQQLDTLTRLAAAYEALGRPASALGHARRALELDPWREPAHRQIMRLLASQGERGQALTQYERCRRILADELGVEPEEATVELFQTIRADRAATQQPESPSNNLVILAPAVVAEPLPTVPARPQVPLNLPVQPTSCIGRERELVELDRLLVRPDCRLVTLLGPGGTGKTRLALQLVERLAGRFHDGACWISLAPLRSLDEFTGTLARALGCAADDTGDLIAQIWQAVATRQMLLALDNLEHLLDAADIAADLLAAGSQLTILATSRERLQLRAEWIYDLGGLAFPSTESADDVLEYDAIRLLTERAGQVRRDGIDEPAERAAAARIAGAVEGNPLALELAAAARRSRPFSAIAIAIESDLDILRVTLRDLPERHRSVRATLEYSWRLLSSAEQQALARLALFRGSFAPEAAKAVARADQELLETLADKSMVRRAGERYELHELLRRFAAEQLAAFGEVQATNEALLAWVMAYAEMAEPLVGGAEQEHWLGRLEADHAHLRAALGWAIEQGRPESAQRVGAALMRFWWVHGHLREGRDWLERALKLEGGTPASRARALHGAGGLAGQMGDLPAARAQMAASLELERSVGRKAELTRVLNNLAFVLINQAEYEEAEALIIEALALDRELADDRGVAFDLGTLGQLAYFQSDYPRAAEYFTESLHGHLNADDTHSIAVTRLNLGSALRLQGRAAEAQVQLEQSLGLFRSMGSSYGVAFSLVQLARLAAAAGKLPEARAAVRESLPLLSSLGTTGELAGTLALVAQLTVDAGGPQRQARLWGAAMALLDQRGASLQPPEMLEFGQQLAQARSTIPAPLWSAGWAEGHAMTTEDAIAEALRALGS